MCWCWYSSKLFVYCQFNAHGTVTFLYTPVIDVLNKDCRRSCSAILTWVLENVKISVRPLNSIGNGRIFTLLLKFYLLPLAHILLRVKCRYISLVCINVSKKLFCRVVFFSNRFFSQTANLSSGMNVVDVVDVVDVVHATRQVCCPAEKTAAKKTTRQKQICVTFMQTRDMYLHFTRSNVWANGNN